MEVRVELDGEVHVFADVDLWWVGANVLMAEPAVVRIVVRVDCGAVDIVWIFTLWVGRRVFGVSAVTVPATVDKVVGAGRTLLGFAKVELVEVLLDEALDCELRLAYDADACVYIRLVASSLAGNAAEVGIVCVAGVGQIDLKHSRLLVD